MARIDPAPRRADSLLPRGVLSLGCALGVHVGCSLTTDLGGLGTGGGSAASGAESASNSGAGASMTVTTGAGGGSAASGAESASNSGAGASTTTVTTGTGGGIYLNFQDPSGPPFTEPLIVNGHTWQKIGWDAYDDLKGYGWSGPHIGDPAIMLYEYISAPVDELQRSIIYDDYGKTNIFEYAIANGTYTVTFSIGWHNENVVNQTLAIEGVGFFQSAETGGTNPFYQVVSKTVAITDGSLTVQSGYDEWVMMNWMSIE